MINLLIATRNNHKVGEIRAILGERFQYFALQDIAGAPEVVEDANTFAGNATKKAVELAKWIATVHGPQSTVHSPQSWEAKAQSPKSKVRNEAFEAALSGAGCVLYVLADDSGLEVDVLKGVPGVHSARFAALDTGKAGNSPTTENNAKLLRLLEGVPLEMRTARFRCVMALTPVLSARPENASPVCAADAFELQTELFEGTCAGRIEFEERGTGGFGYDPLFVPDGYGQTFGELPEEVKNRLSHRARALARLKEKLNKGGTGAESQRLK